MYLRMDGPIRGAPQIELVTVDHGHNIGSTIQIPNNLGHCNVL